MHCRSKFAGQPCSMHERFSVFLFRAARAYRADPVGWIPPKHGRPPSVTPEFLQLISSNKATVDRALGKTGQPFTKRGFHEAFNQGRRDAAGILGFEVVDTSLQTTEKYRKMSLPIVRRSSETQTTARLEAGLNCRNAASLAAGFPVIKN